MSTAKSCSLRWHAPLLTLLAVATLAGSGRASAGEIVGPVPKAQAKYSTEHDPSSLALIETWLGHFGSPRNPRTDDDLYEILDRRVSWGNTGRAVLVFRVLPRDGEAVALASARCRGRTTPFDIQIYYEWSTTRASWVPVIDRGDPGFDDCPDNRPALSADQLAKLLDPPPLPVPPKVLAKDVVTPERGSADRKALLDAVRPIYEKLFGKPIQFEVQSMRVAAGFAFMSVHPQRPNGSPIELAAWNKVIHDCEHTPASVMHEYWMKKDGNVWTVTRKNDFCADDSIAWDGDIVGAPPQLVDKEGWEPRTTYPVD